MRISTVEWAPDVGATRAVALEVLLHGPIARSEIAKKLQLSAGSLTRLAAPLIEAGVLIEGDEQSRGRAGRPSRPLDIVPESRHFLGFKVTSNSVLGVVTDLRATILGTRTANLRSTAVEHVVDIIEALSRELGGLVPSVNAMGIGVGALIGSDGVVRSAPFLEWTDVPLQQLVRERTSIPTVVANDLVAFTEYENWFGAGRELERFAVITLGAGIGYGLVVHDEIVMDDDYGIGLVGHWPMDPYGPLCPAGHRGCARTVLTSMAIAGSVSAALGRTVSYDEALDLAQAGEPAAARVIDEAARGLGRLIAAIANLTMPEMVVIGGEGVRLTSIAELSIRAGMSENRDPRTRELPLNFTSGDDSEWCRGAAVLAIQDYVLP
ncbi:MAG: ROK family transcriptional regulator [Microcella sp.]|uniref:ROK family transcriptional regulator n=1 Tax=Microcella sp. TaxID=1913979 RepID=UPI0024CB5944|nr:ROK family transcriptional regulator [Microcella sp.]UYN83105.1 MAG: ROK family transcriptional regulator [Microcella sp.]